MVSVRLLVANWKQHISTWFIAPKDIARTLRVCEICLRAIQHHFNEDESRNEQSKHRFFIATPNGLNDTTTMDAHDLLKEKHVPTKFILAVFVFKFLNFKNRNNVFISGQIEVVLHKQMCNVSRTEHRKM